MLAQRRVGAADRAADLGRRAAGRDDHGAHGLPLDALERDLADRGYGRGQGWTTFSRAVSPAPAVACELAVTAIGAADGQTFADALLVREEYVRANWRPPP